MLYQEIDWNKLWKEGRSQRAWRPKKKKDWDKRAAGFARRNIGSDYAGQFIRRVQPDPAWSVLDIGCGPGTLALPLAKRVKKVTAIDFSESMLARLQQLAESEKISNITTVQAAWEDDWQAKGIATHDVAIASRSLSVDDLAGALQKIDQWAKKAVFISDKVGSGPFDPTVFKAVGRKFDSGPDYIFTVNVLYSMGIHANVEFITLDRNITYTSYEEALDSCRWMLDNLTASEEKKLQQYIDDHLGRSKDSTFQMHGRNPAKWALIWWKK